MKLLSILFAIALIGETPRPEYFIAIKKNEGDVLGTLHFYSPLYPPQGKFYADPFLFKHQGLNYVFFEDYDYQKGVISYVCINQDLKTSEPRVALELPIHLSFPSIFQDEGEIYMTPETYDNRSVSLFKAQKFPDEWQHVRTLIRGQRFSDPILFKRGGYYWLFVAVKKDRLQIYYAKNLDSEFRPHPINHRMIPGRNAGYVYFMNDQLIRPTMDCSISYGRSMILKEIVRLDPQQFIEKEIVKIEPTWAPNLTGTHTYSQNEEYVVYDGKY